MISAVVCQLHWSQPVSSRSSVDESYAQLCCFWRRQDGERLVISLYLFSRCVELKRNATMHSSEDRNDTAEQVDLLNDTWKMQWHLNKVLHSRRHWSKLYREMKRRVIRTGQNIRKWRKQSTQDTCLSLEN
jgi:hypothetical protein